jgi:hypothetical protein
MKVHSLLLNLSLCTSAALASAASNFAARTNPHVIAEKRAAALKHLSGSIHQDQDGFATRTAPSTGVKNITFANPKASQFYVDGANFPEVDFDIGPSWAGLLPISSEAGETRELFFWFFPPGPEGSLDDLIFWCVSLPCVGRCLFNIGPTEVPDARLSKVLSKKMESVHF